jgi:hypothetical protein
MLVIITKIIRDQDALSGCRGSGRRPAVGREKEVNGGVPDMGGAAEEAASDGDGHRGR